MMYVFIAEYGIPVIQEPANMKWSEFFVSDYWIGLYFENVTSSINRYVYTYRNVYAFLTHLFMMFDTFIKYNSPATDVRHIN